MLWPISWGGNWLMGGLDRMLNGHQSFKQSFSVKNNPVVIGGNYSPSANQFSNSQVDAQTTANLPYIIGTDAYNKARSEGQANSGGVPLTGQGNMTGQAVGGNSTTQFFSSTSDAYNYMWSNSFDAKGNARVEISAWQTSKGTIVMPYYKNSLRVSYNDYLPIKTINGQKNVYYNDLWNVISGHIHTHPSYNGGNIGVSGGDYDMGAWLKMPTTILWDNRAWQLNGRGSNPTDLGKW